MRRRKGRGYITWSSKTSFRLRCSCRHSSGMSTRFCSATSGGGLVAQRSTGDHSDHPSAFCRATREAARRQGGVEHSGQGEVCVRTKWRGRGVCVKAYGEDEEPRGGGGIITWHAMRKAYSVSPSRRSTCAGIVAGIVSRPGRAPEEAHYNVRRRHGHRGSALGPRGGEGHVRSWATLPTPPSTSSEVLSTPSQAVL